MRIAHVANTDYFCAFLLRPQLREARAAGHDVHVVCGPGPMVETLRRDGFRVHLVENSRRIEPLEDLRTLGRYVRLFRRERFELIHTHNPKINALAALAARMVGVRSVVSTVHGLYSHEGQRPWVRRTWRTLERNSARLADLVLCQSAEDVRTARQQRIVSNDRLRSLGNGIDIARFSPTRFGRDDRDAIRRSLGFGPDDFVVGFVGRLVREKGIPELLLATAARRGWRLLLVGPDERGVKRDALDPAVFAGHAGARWIGLQSDLPPLYAAMDVATLPSHREGLPRTLLEAQAMATPVVATRTRGCREAVVDGQSGWLVPTRRPRALGAALEALAKDPALRLRLGLAGRDRAERLYDEQAVFDRIELAYRELARPSRLPMRLPVRADVLLTPQ
ncbi:MAG: glycosyltransferase family 4 protein [Myxococcota bacterium]